METIKAVEVTGEGHIAALEALAQSIWREHYIPIIGEAQVEYMLGKFQSKEAIARQIREEGHLYYLLEDASGKRVGYFGVIPRKDELFLSKFYIAAKDRGKGFGRRALEFIEAIAKDKGLHRLSLTVNKNNTGSIEAYKRLGFVITDSLVTDIGSGFVMDDYKMEKAIVDSPLRCTM